MRLIAYSNIVLLMVAFADSAWGRTILFPEDDFLPGWEAGEVEAYNTSSDLFDYMDGGAELYLEYRFAGLEVCEYSSNGGGQLSIEIYAFASSEDAYGLFSLDTSGTRVEIGQEGRSSAWSTRFWQDRRFVRTFIWDTGPEFEGVAEAAARSVAEKMDQSGQLPAWLQNLRGVNLQPFFVRGDIALRQVAGWELPQDIPFERRTGAAWIAPRSPDTPGCLVLAHSTEAKAAQTFQTLWDRIRAGSVLSALVADRGLVSEADGEVKGIERRGPFILWVPTAPDETSCAQTLDTIGSALSGQEE